MASPSNHHPKGMATVSPSDPLQDIAESGSLHIKEMERDGSSLFRVVGGHLFHNGQLCATPTRTTSQGHFVTCFHIALLVEFQTFPHAPLLKGWPFCMPVIKGWPLSAPDPLFVDFLTSLKGGPFRSKKQSKTTSQGHFSHAFR